MGDRLATVDMGQKLGAMPLLEGASWAPSNTILNFILMRPTVWPQYANVTDRTDRQTDRQTGKDSGPIAYGEPVLGDRL